MNGKKYPLPKNYIKNRYQLLKMRSWIVVPVLCAVLQLAHAQCDLKDRKFDKAFPNIEADGFESYQMSVEYTLPDSKQTDYYVEYYDLLEQRGRVDGHLAGKTLKYVYRTATWEAWEITDDECKLKNITDTQELLREVQTDWLYLPPNKPERRTFGPSAMFKIAFDTWNSSSKEGKMGYMGKAEGTIRGLNAEYWRRCDTENSYVDYFFADDEDENPFGLKNLKRLPLRVFFGGTRKNRQKEFAIQEYDIINFQPYISLDIQPFQLPVGLGCKRGPLAKEKAPEIPDFKTSNYMFSAEVIYRKVDRSGDDVQLYSYYSTLYMALDLFSDHLAYRSSAWKKSSTTTEEPDVEFPQNIVFDMKHGFVYNYTFEEGKCEISRRKDFTPTYKLPDGGASIALTDNSMLYPNDEFTFITEGTNRGLKVNVFEEVVEGYVLNNKVNPPVQAKKAVISHSYLQNDVVQRNVGSVKNSLAQIQLRLTGRFDGVIEIITFNFFGFSTELRDRRSIFDIKKCFRNDDDYVWATIGFNADDSVLQKVKNDIPSIQSEILSAIKLQSELNAVRIPVVEVDFKDGIYVSLMILGRPPVILDYEDPVDGKTITDSTEVEGVSDTDTCALKCLESMGNCWGFSICGAVCTFGNTASAKVSNKAGCKLYRRYTNGTTIPSKELMIENLRSEVQTNRIKLELKDADKNMIQFDATSFEVSDPGEDDKLFDRMGNTLNPRMRVLKAGYKLKLTAGATVKNMGKLRYDECQRVCLDYRSCESISYCLTTSECILTMTYGDDIKADAMEENNMCNILTRKYADHFNRSPGNVLSITAKEVLSLDTVEKCARACLTKTDYKCLSFDHCPTDKTCKLHTVHYPNAKTREDVQTKSTNCGHYFRKFSTEFKRNPEKRTVGSKLPPLSNLTLEECSKSCIEYGKGTCFGFDFCQGSTMLATSCILLDSDPSKMKTTYSQICTNYLRTEAQFAPRPYSNSYAGGIGFLCFLIGAIVGVLIVFGIAYLKVNRR
ncbi:uncharacterized protein TNCT_639221 [Trichonephila clavata]|uniref:Apple domain-containing protein n=2 Tax=Trichonephila TaxID=2585208 RepID=A0A8X6HNF8_TRICU|nr:uncharacterized protein TNCT_639221 [Trichonephila clavata]